MTIVAAAGITASTGAFLSDTETSAGNTFTAGAIDLKVDNESYYNGAISEGTTWLVPDDLGDGLLFFNFRDMKPDDEGEDTISLHVNNNDAYLCMDVSMTSNDDISSNEPEMDTSDPQDDPNNTWDGELGGLLNMFWWADDGDNVYEAGENSISGGIKTALNLATSTPFSVALADTANNVWTPDAPGPISGGQTKYIGKAFCYGDMALNALAQDGVGTDGPLAPNREGTGFTCDGKTLGNESQTDGVTMDVAFRAMQARHNPNFFCSGQDTRTAKLTVIKEIVNDNGGNNDVLDFQLFVDNGTVSTPVTSSVATQVSAGSYTVGETGVSGYEASFSGECNASGELVLAPGDNKTCTITNDDIRPNITLIKNVTNNNSGNAVATDFKMRVNGSLVPTGGSKPVNSNTNVTITEDAFAGYTATGISGTGCPANLGDVFQLNEGVAITCTVTNDDN